MPVEVHVTVLQTACGEGQRSSAKIRLEIVKEGHGMKNRKGCVCVRACVRVCVCVLGVIF